MMGRLTTYRALIYIILMMILSIALPVNSIAQSNPDTTGIQEQVARRIRERFGPRLALNPLSISVNRDGVVEGIRGAQLRLTFSTQDPIDRAYELLEQHQDIFGITNPRQVLFLEGIPVDSLGHQEHPNITSDCVGFVQRVNGVQVLYSAIRICISSDSDSLYMYYTHDSSPTYALIYESSYQPQARNVDTTPTITAEQAMDFAKAYPANGTGRLEAEPHGIEIMKGQDSAYHLVWKIGVGGGVYRGDAFFYVDAHTGEIVKIEAAWRE